MNIPDRIVGVLELNDTKSPFELVKETFELRLYNTDSNDAFSLFANELQCLSSNIKEHKWVDNIIIKGRTSEGYLIYFGTTDNPYSYNGYLTYNVAWFYISNNKSDTVNEIWFSGREIDCFYNPARAFQQSIKYKENDGTCIESMSVQTTDNEDLFCGQYISENGKIDVYCSAYATMHFNSDAPFDSNSCLKLKLSQGIELNAIVMRAKEVQSFLKYVCYRTNICFSDISTFISKGDGKIHNCGKLVFKEKHNEECNEKAKKRIIKAEYLKEHTAELLMATEKGEMPYGYFCHSIADISHYPISRIIMILAAFESEFRNSYGQDARRSEEYKETKKDVVTLLTKYAESLSGKHKKYVNGFVKGILNSDSSYGDNLLYAFQDCKTIMEPFAKKRFNGSYEEITEAVSSSVNELRNGIAHSRLDLKIEARHLTDIKLVEELLYAVRLKKLGIQDILIQKSINDLFQENFAI